jgi:gamma-glutamyl-gamma-aminobutyrate hydrolase PuuD
MQRLTNRRTCILRPSATLRGEPLKLLERHMEKITYCLPIDLPLQEVSLLDPQAMEYTGLVLIPGSAKNNYTPQRIQLERECIRQALLRGQPILAVCAGCWSLWNCLTNLGTREVRDHCNARMMHLGRDGNVVNNPAIHTVNIEQTSLLGTLMEPQNLAVNSVHWEAVNATETAAVQDARVRISAWSSTPTDPERKNRQCQVMKPETGCVEAFERTTGAPVIGIQWHPEAYNSRRYRRLFSYLAAAGGTYLQKRRLLQELLETRFD